MTTTTRSWSQSQFEAISARGENVIVSAGAGSGKTSVLVERVVDCVMSDATLDLTQVLVVTFTEAAAAEMRRRIGDRFKELLSEAVLQGHESLIRRLTRLQHQLDQAQISTLHSFCMQIVRQNYLFLEIEPSFGMLSEEESVLLRSECLKAVMEERLQRDDGPVFRAAMEQFGARDVTQIAPLVYRLDGFSRSQAGPTEWLVRMSQNFEDAQGKSFNDLPWTKTFADWCYRLLTDASQNLEEAFRIAQGHQELEKYVKNLDALLPLVTRAVECVARKEWDNAVLSLRAAVSEKTPQAKDHPVKEHVKSLRTAALDAVKLVLEILGRGTIALHEDVVLLAPSVCQLVDFVIQFQARYMERKRELSMLDFNDLEHFAYAVLTDASTGEAERLQSLFGEIFVDEFQDTSPIQDALVSAIGRVEGNVFVVGDVKQSIYRFRMAEPSLFLNKYYGRKAGARYRPIHLSENYRSRASVVNTVNHLFSQILSEEFGGAAYDEHARMVRAANYPDESYPNDLSGPVEVHFVDRDSSSSLDSAATNGEAGGKDTAADEGRTGDDGADAADREGIPSAQSEGETVTKEELLAIEREARVIAQRISTWMGRGREPRRQVWDAKRKAFRPLEYRDIVVLLRSVKGRMTPLLDVFQEFGIPAYGVTSTGFYGSLEVRWLLSCLSAIDNPRREIELVALLRSPMFGFTDEDLARIRLVARENFYDTLKLAADNLESAELAGKIQAFIRQLNAWRRLSRRATTEDVVRRVLDDTGLLEYVTAMPGGRVRAANVETFAERARAFDRSSTEGLFGFISQSRQLLAHEIDIGEARTLAEAEDVVRIMTIHQSKGLEFPVVFVADLGKLFYRDPLERSLPLHRELGFGPMRIDPATDQRWRTVASIAIEESDVTEFLAEEARILYVAITRAREQLVLVGSSRKLRARLETVLRSASMTEFPYPARVLLRAKSAMDWLLYALWRHESAAKTLLSSLPADSDAPEMPPTVSSFGSTYSVHVWSQEDILSLNPSSVLTDESIGEGQQAIVPADVLYPLRQAMRDGDDGSMSRLLPLAELPTHGQGLNFSFLSPEGGPPAKVSATDLRRLWAARNGKKEHSGFAARATAEGLLEDPVWVKERTVTGRERGTAFHAVIEHIDFSIEKTSAAVASELERLTSSNVLMSEEIAACETADILSFLNSPLGLALEGATRILREQPFFHRLDLSDGEGRDDYVTVQGVIDCLAELPDKWILLDYKTDRIGRSDVEGAAMEYAAQLSVYLEVASALVGDTKPIEAWLYFVQPAVPVPLRPVPVRRLFEKSPHPL